MYSLTFLGALAVLPAANCVAFGGPAPTLASPDHLTEGFNPLPTKAPVAELLHKRVFEFAPFDTCGWVEGEFDVPLTCPGLRECMHYTARGVGMVGCCSSSDFQRCGWATGCIDYNDYYSSDSCDGDCMVNTFIIKCTQSTAPFCASFTYSAADVKDFHCRSYSSSFFQRMALSVTETDGSRSLSVSLPTLSGTAVTGWEASDGRAVSSSSQTSSPTPSPIPSSSSTTGRRSSRLGTGIIVGIVVAGVVVLLVVLATFIFFCMKKRKAKKRTANHQLDKGAQTNGRSPYDGLMPMSPTSQPGAPILPSDPNTQFSIPHQQNASPPYVPPYQYGNGAIEADSLPVPVQEADSRPVGNPSHVGLLGSPASHQNGVYEMGYAR